MSDKTRCQIGKALSKFKLQQELSPCEERQFYKCVCLDEPWCDYGEAVAKVKMHQV
jgi:hypothetical protein